MSKFAISDRTPRSSWPAAAWQLLQTVWVGGIVLLHFLVLPGLLSVGLAPLLVDEVARALVPQMVGIALLGALLQAGVLVRLRGLLALFGERVGQLLLVSMLLAALLLALLSLWPQALYWQSFGYLLLTFCGVWLVLQPLPAARAAVAVVDQP